MSKFKLIIFVFIFIVIFCVVGSFFVQADTEILEEEDILNFQNRITNSINVYGYTFDNPNIIVNPYGDVYNSALIVFETEDYVSINVNINDIDSYKSKFTNKHYIGLYNLLDGSNKIILSYGKKNKEIDITIDKGETNIDFSKSTILSNNHLLVSTSDYISNGDYTGIREIDTVGKIYYEYLIEEGYKGLSCEIDDEKLGVLSENLIILDRQNGNIIKELDISNYRFNWLGMDYYDNKINLYGDAIAISVDMDGKITEIEKEYEKEYISGDLNYNNREGIRFYKEIFTDTVNKNFWLLKYNKNMDEKIEIKKEFNRLIIYKKNNNDCNNYLILDKLFDKRVYELCDETNYIYTYDMDGKYSIYFKIDDVIYKTDEYLNF